jgi:hypothetical protein
MTIAAALHDDPDAAGALTRELRRRARRLDGARLRATRGLLDKDRPRENRPHAYAAQDSARPLRPVVVHG